MVKIGNVELAGRLFLAPMAGVTDASFRLLCRKHGAALATSEMISSKALMYQDGKTKTLLVRPEGDTPLAVQIFGSDPSCMAEAACKVIDLCRPEIIDINMGCPVGKVVKSGDGSALMKTPDLAAKIIESVVHAVDVPVTVQFRKGFDKARMEEALGQITTACSLKGEKIAILEARKQLCWYLRGVSHAGYYKQQIVSMNTLADAEKIVRGIQRDLR